MLPSFFIGETTLFIHFFCGVFYNLYFCASIDETKINTYDEEFEDKVFKFAGLVLGGKRL
jgi:hypothetical protein